MIEQTNAVSPPLITVLMPIYNSPNVIASVNSVLEQDYGAIELILIDDGSCNFSANDMRSYLEIHAGHNLRNWRIIENTKNLGTVRSLNRGIRLSHGEIIFNLAGDDLFSDGRVLSDWVRAFEETSATVMLGVRENYNDDYSIFIGTTPNKCQIGWMINLTPDELFEKIAVDNFLSGCCTARRRDFFEKYGLYDEQYKLIEDFPAALRFLRNGGKIAFFNRKVIKYRGGGISSVNGMNSDYRQDIRLIYENEIIPYTKYPKRARRWLCQWRRSTAFDKKYLELTKRYGSNNVVQVPLRIWYYLHHPHQVLKMFLK